jgi:hypothetical protein
VSEILVALQSKTVVEVLFAIEAIGAMIFCVIVVLAVDIQPLPRKMVRV